MVSHGALPPRLMRVSRGLWSHATRNTIRSGSSAPLPCLYDAVSILSDLVHVPGPGIPTQGVEASTPFEVGLYDAVIAFDAEHCIKVRTPNELRLQPHSLGCPESSCFTVGLGEHHWYLMHIRGLSASGGSFLYATVHNSCWRT